MISASGDIVGTLAASYLQLGGGGSIRALAELFDNLKRGDQFTWTVFGIAAGGAIGVFAFYKLFSNDEWTL